ncbi:uncharacterized protein F54H12.2-like [Nasonia vitripennis]|uniref:Uncharacterized protein n=1 Tax=Nasonia vitripennis TaxID=7425 RepID=A0A7M7T8P6_NASVI|nr:uncharacterized protein F54H12.2-like [Nasonia vitripennis]
MAFLHSHSTECMSSELDLFTLPATQTSIESSSFLHYKPVSSLSDDVDAPLEFVVPAGSEHYFDLAHTMLHLQAKIVPADETTATTENLKKMVSPPNNAYPYRAYIDTLLNYAPAAKESHFTASLWYDDTSGGFDSPANAVSTATAPMIVNKGLENRKYLTQNRRYFDMIGHLHHDLFNQNKMLIKGVEMRVRLARSKDAFSLMDATTDGKFKLSIKEATLIVRRVKISPGVLLAHAQALSETTAKYLITRVEVKSFTLHSGILGDSIDNIIHGQLPKRIILGFVENKAFNGNRA